MTNNEKEKLNNGGAEEVKEEAVAEETEEEAVAEETEEEAVAEEIEAEAVTEETEGETTAEEMIGGETDAGEAIAAAEIDRNEKPKKKGKIRGFFKTRKLAVGITVLVVLLVANVAVFGANKMSGKGHRDHGGKTVERQYTEGQKFERGDKESGIYQDSEKVPRGEKDPRGDGACEKDGSKVEKGEKGTKSEAGKVSAEEVGENGEAA